MDLTMRILGIPSTSLVDLWDLFHLLLIPRSIIRHSRANILVILRRITTITNNRMVHRWDMGILRMGMDPLLLV